MTKIYRGMPHLNGNLLCAVDFETTGTRAGYHEPIQIAVVPLDADLSPMEGVSPFYRFIKPLYPERAHLDAMRVNKLDLNELCLHALDPGQVEDLLVEWFNDLDLPFGKSLVPLAHNWPFESSFLTAWLGEDLKSKLFHPYARDTLQQAIYLNDRAFCIGEKAPFTRVSLSWLSSHFGVVNPKPHDALYDCIAEAEVFKKLLCYEFFTEV